MMDKDDYEVGYKSPPQHSQFKKGQSGNTKGRPKGSKSYVKILQSVVNEKIRVREGDKISEMTKLEALTRRLVEKSMKGGLQETQAVFKILEKYTPNELIEKIIIEHVSADKKDGGT